MHHLPHEAGQRALDVGSESRGNVKGKQSVQLQERMLGRRWCYCGGGKLGLPVNTSLFGVSLVQKVLKAKRGHPRTNPWNPGVD